MQLIKKLTDRKIVVVTRETRIDNLKRRFNSLDQASFYLKKRGSKVEDYIEEDRNYKRSRSTLEDSLNSWGYVQFIDRAYLPNFVFGPEDTVVAIGQDGLVANTLKYLRNGQPLIGVNPDPGRWDGVLLPFVVDDLPEIIPEVLANTHHEKQVTMARTALNDGQEMFAVNDFFVGQKSHTSARYLIESGGRKERHSSSGVIVSTGLGSTGWLKSLLRGANAISTSTTGAELPPQSVHMDWDSPELVFTVREPFPSQATQTDLVFGKVHPNTPLKIRSLMPENGVLFSDGIESDFLEFNSGTEAIITVADVRGHLVTR